MSEQKKISQSEPQLDRHPNFNRSSNMGQVLFGTPQINKLYFIDSLQRFKKDYAVYHKQELACKRQKRALLLEKKQQEMQNLTNHLRSTNIEHQIKQEMKYSSQLRQLQQGLRKNGLTTGIPVNPVTNEYQSTQRGSNFEEGENEKHLSNLLRMHLLQKKGTCGYNPINGKENLSVTSLVPREKFEDLNSRICRYDSQSRLKPPHY